MLSPGKDKYTPCEVEGFFLYEATGGHRDIPTVTTQDELLQRFKGLKIRAPT